MSERMSADCVTRVIAKVNIPSGTKSRPFGLSQVAEVINLNRIQFPLEFPWLCHLLDAKYLIQSLALVRKHHTRKVKLTQNGEIDLEDSKDRKRGNPTPDWFWIKCIQFATDCHVQNVRICRWQNDAVILQVTKEIDRGADLLLWFGEDVLVNDLGIPPYLNPQNIRGGKNYTCHKCGKEFETPNPLKVHLALSCGTQPIDDLWSRMATPRSIIPQCLNLRITPPTLPFPAVGLRAPFYVPESLIPASTAPSQRFKISRSVPASTLPLPPAHVKSLSDQQAQLETIMSNMGRGKNGHHVCVYCGKLYSRKYGLKIHIRTHTGFKPLQCKICHRPFGDPSNLNKHVRLHADGNTPYRCDICTKVLVRRRDLDRHIRSRHSTLGLELPTQQSAIDCSIKQNAISSLPNNSNSNVTISVHSALPETTTTLL